MADTYTSPNSITTVQAGAVGLTIAPGNRNVSVNFGVGIYENAKNITTNYCITTGTSGFSAGPINISAVVTIPNGSSWTIR
jgi:hypothetical protein